MHQSQKERKIVQSAKELLHQDFQEAQLINQEVIENENDQLHSFVRFRQGNKRR